MIFSFCLLKVDIKKREASISEKEVCCKYIKFWQLVYQFHQVFKVEMKLVLFILLLFFLYKHSCHLKGFICIGRIKVNIIFYLILYFLFLRLKTQLASLSIHLFNNIYAFSPSPAHLCNRPPSLTPDKQIDLFKPLLFLLFPQQTTFLTGNRHMIYYEGWK